jgi:ubiquinol-cytochrome c reductase subunit 7
LRLASRLPSLTGAQTRNFISNNITFKRFAFNASGFNQFGLYHDDALYENEDVIEALNRLPQTVLDERSFRIQRAVNCSMLKTVLPKDQWPTYDEDRAKGRYLQPYLNEVKAEKKEREAWGSQA